MHVTAVQNESFKGVHNVAAYCAISCTRMYVETHSLVWDEAQTMTMLNVSSLLSSRLCTQNHLPCLAAHNAHNKDHNRTLITHCL